MKIKIKSQPAAGSALVVTLVLGVVLLFIMVSYLQLLGTQSKLVVRSETWNAALSMAEAGIEEAMAQINISPTDLSANSWGVSGSVYGPVTRTLAGSSYSVIISNASSPVIYSTGSVPVPVSGGRISRKVMVTTTQQSLANIALGTRHGIRMNGNALAVDSTPNGTNGNVATMGGAVSVGNRNINGNLYLAPGATWDIQHNGTVGTVYSNANINFPDVTLPGGTFTAATLTNSTYRFTTSGNYTISSSGGSPIDVAPGVTVNLQITVNTTYSPGSVQIHGGTTNSGTANFYLNGPTTLVLIPNSATDSSGKAGNLNYYGLPNLTTITALNGNAAFKGTVYAPSASFTFNGGGNDTLDFLGSIVVDAMTMNGHFALHYDESLSSTGAQTAVIKIWQEL